jgi:hypothetical protein
MADAPPDRPSKADPDPDATSVEKPTSDNERLDEGLEETFPASDPVSAKHID